MIRNKEQPLGVPMGQRRIALIGKPTYALVWTSGVRVRMVLKSLSMRL